MHASSDGNAWKFANDHGGGRRLSNPEGNHAIRSGSRSRPIFLKRKHVSGSWARCGSSQTPDQTREPLAAHFAPYGEIGRSHGGARDAYRAKRDQARVRAPGRSDGSLVAGQSASLGSRAELVRWRAGNSTPKSRHASLGRQSPTAGHFLRRNSSSWPPGCGEFLRHWVAPDYDSGRVKGNPLLVPQGLPCSFS